MVQHGQKLRIYLQEEKQWEGAGTNTAGLIFGGASAVANTDETEKWDGTSWSEVNDLNNGRRGEAGCGLTNTAALCASGEAVAETDFTEEWDGTSWSEKADLNTPRFEAGMRWNK